MDSAHDIASFKSEGLNLTYRRFGKPGKTPVLLLHGLLYFSYDWIATAVGLATDREIVALDQRGFGDSDWSATKDYKVADYARDAKNLIDHLGWAKAIVVGHSMGGRNAVCCAITYPDRVAGLVLVDAPPYNAPHGARRIGDQVAGTPDRFSSLDEALEYFPTTPYKDRFEPIRRTRFAAYMRDVPGGIAIKRDPYFHALFRKVKEGWPYHSYEYETWPIGREFDAWAAWERIVCPALVVVGMGVGDVFAPEMVEKVRTFAATKNDHIRVVTHITHHNIPGKTPDLLVKDIEALATCVEQGENLDEILQRSGLDGAIA